MKHLVFVFPGQGSQYAGMGKELNDGFLAARRVFEEANEALGYDLRELMFTGNLEQLTRTEHTQPALLAVSVAAFRVYMEQVGVQPAYGAGHSLGEFSALCCAGVIGFADAVRIVSQRGKFMQEAAAEGTGAMCAVLGADGAAVAAACAAASGGGPGRTVVISNYNSPGQMVISGHREAVDAAAQALAAQGARTVPLTVSAPFHSPLMAPAAGKLERELRKLTYGQFQWPVVSNVTAAPYADPAEVVELLTKQLTSPVRWDASMHYLQQSGVRQAVELGPQQVLTNLMRANAREIACYPLEKPGQLAAIAEVLGADAAAERAGGGSLQAGPERVCEAVRAEGATSGQAAESGLQAGLGQVREAVRVVAAGREAGSGLQPKLGQTSEGAGAAGKSAELAREVGPGAVDAVRAAQGASVQADQPATIAAASVNNVVTRCLAAAVCTRNGNDNEAEYRTGVIEPYRRIQAIQERLDESGAAPDKAQMQEALELLKRILDTKRVTLREQRERFKEILEETGTYALFSHFYADGLFAKSGGERIGLSFH